MKFQLLYAKKPVPSVQLSLFLINGIKICLVYRSPNIKKEDDEIFAKFLENEDICDCYLVGDLNLDTVTWTNPPKSSNSRHLRLANILNLKNLKNIVNQQTHIKGNCLDVLFVPYNSKIAYMQVIEDFLVADHYAIQFEFPANLPDASKFKTIQLTKQINTDHYRDLLRFHKFENNFHEDIDMWSNELTETISTYRHAVIPTKVISCAGQYGGHNSETLRKFRDVAELRRKGDMVNWQIEKAVLDRMVKAEKEKEHEDYLKYLAANRNNIYKVKKKATFKNEIQSIKLSSGEISAEPEKVAECLSDFYKSVLQFEDPIEYDNHPDPFDRTGLVLENVTLTPTLVKKTIKRFKNSENPGSDGVSMNSLKDAVEELHKPLYELFRRSLETSSVPGSWKRTKIEPLPKTQDSREPNQTRPINKSSPISKVLEKIISDEIFNALEFTKFFNRCQYGFRKRMSTIDNLLEFTAKIVEALQTSDYHVVVFDFAKAFDKVPHSILLQKLWRAGIRGKLFLWIKDWLRWRSQFVHFQDYDSADVHSCSSVVQGSCLGVCLFLVFINDLPDCIFEVIVSLFADDLKMGKKIQSFEDCRKLQLAIDQAYDWSITNKMEFNAKKCAVMYYGSNKFRFQYTIGGKSLVPTEDFVDLGINYNVKLGFAPHVNTITNKAKVAAIATKRNFKGLSWAQKCQAYTSYIAPLIEYGCALWSPKSDFKKLNSVFEIYFQDCKPPENAEIPLTPQQRCLYFEMMTFKKEVERYQKLRVTPPLLLRREHAYSTRFKQQILPPKQQPKLLSNLLVRRFDIWISIPEEIREGPSSLYKKFIQEHILTSCPSNLIRQKLQSGNLLSKRKSYEKFLRNQNARSS